MPWAPPSSSSPGRRRRRPALRSRRCATRWRPQPRGRRSCRSSPATRRWISVPDRAAAPRHDGTSAPRVVAAGNGELARRIVEEAREAGVAVREDPALAEALARLELDAEVPEELWRAVAEVLVWAQRLDGAARA